MFKLVIADDEGKTFVVPLVRDEISIGRKEGNTIRLTERNVSRKHARLRRANGGFHLEDLSSYNGVKVNGKRIGGETDLKAGDQITIGDYQLALQVEGADTQPTVPEAAAPAVGVGGEGVTAMIAAPGGPPARLVMMSPPNPGQEFALNRASVRLGRAEDLDIWVNHRSISREHAEIKVDGDTYRISDLASANGLRVNGQDTRNAELRPGDTIEIGQVRFKFVGPGEHFVFDEGRTMQMDAVAFAPDAPNRTPMYIAGGIVALAVVAGIAVAIGGGGDAPADVVVTPVGGGTAPLPVTGPTSMAAGHAAGVGSVVPVPGGATDAEVVAAVAACRASLAAGEFGAATGHAERALLMRAGDPDAADCRDAVADAQAEYDAYVRAIQAEAAGNLDAAVMALEELPTDSVYRTQPEVGRIVGAWADQQVILAESSEAADPTTANRLAAGVLAVAGVPASARARAEGVVQRTRPRGGGARSGGSSGGGPVRIPSSSGGAVAAAGSSGGSSGATVIPPRGGSSGGSTSSSGGAATSGSSGGGSSSSGGGSASSGGGSSSSGGGAAADEDGGGADILAQARAAALRGDHREVIRLLNGRARTRQELELLIESLRATPGMDADVIRNMRTYTTRFPDTPRARSYQQYLMTHGG